MVHVNGKKRARHGRLAIRRQIFFCPMRMDDFIRPNTFVVKAPLVVSFYRGGMVPILQRRASRLQAIKAEFDSLNANLVVLSPETRDLPRQLRRQLNPDLTMLADVDHGVAISYGLLHPTNDVGQSTSPLLL